VVALLAVLSPAAPPERVHLTIVHTNDLHGYVQNAAAIAAVAREARARNPRTLLLDAGDAISGTPVSTVFRGEPVFEVMTLMGYDAATLGNHEFDHGWKQIARFRALAAHPLLCANAKDPAGGPLGDEPYRVFEVGGVRVGVIGLLSEDTPRMTTTANWDGCSVEPPIAAAKRLVPEVRAKADLVVLLTHVGVEADAAIAGAVPGIDLVVGGHSHTELKEALWAPCGDRKVPIVQAFRYGERVGIVDFDWDPSERAMRGFRSRLVTIDAATMPNAPDVKALADQWTKKAGERVDLGEVIGSSKRKLDRAALRTALERIFAELLGADFGFQNLAGVRADIEAGDIRVEDVWKVLPFENTLVTLRLSGDQVPAYARKRLGKDFDPKKSYAFATNSYVGDQQRKYFGVQGVAVEPSGLAMRAAVVDWVRKHKGFAVEDGAPVHDDAEGEKR
jgi:2',3'-cyclic-nucleotide 2'-phosphodiesterase (5'-nucleotidase family)